MKWRFGSVSEKKLREEMNRVLERKRSGRLFWEKQEKILGGEVG
jgi:hypothetical protein